MIPFSSLFFYCSAFVLLLASLGVVLARNPMYNVLSLVLAIFSLSSIFISLQAYFVGIILILVYAGAVLVFFLFVVMCLNLNAPVLRSEKDRHFKFLGAAIGLFFLSDAMMAIKSFLLASQLPSSSLRGTIETIGQILFTDYLLPFELTSLLLLIAVFGIVSLAKGAFKTK